MYTGFGILKAGKTIYKLDTKNTLIGRGLTSHIVIPVIYLHFHI